jgi:hypothetical protein
MAIRAKERDTLVQALRAGVVPRTGLHHVQVGRKREVEEILRDVDRIADGGAAVRFVIGEYGSGKTFFLYLARSVAIQRGLVTAHADLSPQHRLHATGGQARALYAELMSTLATRTKPEGGALASVIERFINDAHKQAAEQGRRVGDLIREKLGTLEEFVGGYDLATVLTQYHRAFEQGDDNLKTAALRWLRGEFTTKTEARTALGVRDIIDDNSVYDHLRLMARFARLAGYGGLLVVLDEMVNIYKIVNAQARNSNYEQILRIVNNVLQGNTGHLGVFFGGTSEFLTNERRGVYSYAALRSRLAENTFTREGLVDMSGPVLRLDSLTTEELHVLLEKLRQVFAYGDESKHLVPDEALRAFMQHCSRRIGDAYFRTPRTTIKAFLDLLVALEQNPGTTWEQLLDQTPIEADRPPVMPDVDDEAPLVPGRTGAPDDLADFRL